MVMSRKELKDRLTSIKPDNFKLESGEDPVWYAKTMLNCIGDVDPDFRDGLIYEAFCYWITEYNYFKKDQLLWILDTVMDCGHLFFRIGSEGADAVFTRTFSALKIDLLLYQNTVDEFIDTETFEKVKDNAIKYYKSEKDLRGFVEGKGWAHGAAHGADVLDTITKSRGYREDMGIDILEAVKTVLHNGKYIFHNEEDERITMVVKDIIMNNQLPKYKIYEWLDSLIVSNGDVSHMVAYTNRVNTKLFIRSLYFYLMRKENTKEITDRLFDIEEKLNRFINY